MVIIIGGHSYSVRDVCLPVHLGVVGNVDGYCIGYTSTDAPFLAVGAVLDEGDEGEGVGIRI